MQDPVDNTQRIFYGSLTPEGTGTKIVGRLGIRQEFWWCFLAVLFVLVISGIGLFKDQKSRGSFEWDLTGVLAFFVVATGFVLGLTLLIAWFGKSSDGNTVYLLENLFRAKREGPP